MHKAKKSFKLKVRKHTITVYDLFEYMFVTAGILNFQTMWITIKPYAMYIDLLCKIMFVFSGVSCILTATNRRRFGQRNLST